MRFRHVLLLLATSLAAYAQTLSLSGVVSDVRSTPIADVTVTLTGSSAGRKVATTDASGKYQLTGLATGNYLLVFDHASFESATRTGDLAADTEVNVSLPVKGEVVSIDVVDVAGKATASRLEIPDDDLPVQVSSISQQLLQQQGVNSMVEALKNASGVQAFRWYGVYEYYTIRGFNQADVMLVDGMRLEGNRMNTQTNNIESIEVLKGPSSVLYGGGALGGVINVVRKKPQNTRAHELMYRGGRFNTHQIAGGSTGRIGNLSRWMYRTDASYEHSDGWRSAGSDRINVSPSLTWLMNERARFTVHQAFNRDRFDGDGGVDIAMTTLPNYDPTWRFSLPQDNVLVEDSQTHLLFNANLSSAWEFRNGFLLRRTSDRYFVTEGIYYNPAANQAIREPLDFHHTRRPIQNQADLIGRLKFLGMHHTLLAGYEYQDFYTRTDTTIGDDPGCFCGYWPNSVPPIDLNTLKPIAPDPTLDITTVARSVYQANQIHAGYWQDQIDVLPNLKINIAGRYDNYNRRAHRTFASAPDVRTNIQTRNQDAYTYRAGIVYTPYGNHSVYFNSATSFSPVTTVPANGAELRPQHGRTYEVGHRWKHQNGTIWTDLAAYIIERDGQTVQVSQIVVRQVGSLKSKGIDLDINADLGWNTRLIANYGFAQATYDDPGNSLDHRFPRYVPKHTANVWLRKEWNAGFNAAIGTRYVGPQFANNANDIRIGGFNTLSGAFGLRKQRWEWSLNADNLFNRGRYFIPGHFDNIVFPGAPINVSTSLRLRFN
ncbi:MAG: TonB-dependent receptor [Acidobacteriota bacterium]